MRRVVEPPAVVPVARSQGARVEVLASDWRVRGTRVTTTPAPSPGWSALSPAQVAEHGLLVETDVEPMTVQVRFFASLGADGVPDSDPVVAECTASGHAGPGCSFAMTADGLRVALAIPDSTAAIVVMCAWYIPARSRLASPNAPDADTASWGIRFAGR